MIKINEIDERLSKFEHAVKTRKYVGTEFNIDYKEMRELMTYIKNLQTAKATCPFCEHCCLEILKRANQ